jgi:hypothetical protein
MALIAWIIPGCSSSFNAQDDGTGNNTNPPDYNNQNNNQDNQSDYDEYNVDDLNQYGEWEDVNQYGRVWRPEVVNNWQPFTNGHWTYDGNDWVWVSYEPFGWIVYHYGSWDFTPEYGWFWIPARDAWSPARVQWIDYGDNIGWAPMRAHNRNWSEPWENNNVHPWMVVRTEDFNRENINSYGVPTVSRVNTVNPNQIQRRQPELKIVQSHVREPIKIVRIDKQQQPVRTVTPPVRNDNAPIRYPAVRNDAPPVRNDAPPVRTDNPPVRNDNQPVRTITPPVINDAAPVPNRNTPNVRPQNNRNIIHMQVPPEEKQKVDRHQPQVVKDVLIKRVPRPKVIQTPKVEDKKNNDNK